MCLQVRLCLQFHHPGQLSILSAGPSSYIELLVLCIEDMPLLRAPKYFIAAFIFDSNWYGFIGVLRHR